MPGVWDANVICKAIIETIAGPRKLKRRVPLGHQSS